MAAARFLFVHDAWHGAWTFDLVRLELERRRVPCVALDLPALGDDPAAPAAATFADGVERIVEAIGTRRDWTLVAHGLGGLYATEAAIRTSGKLRGVAYLAAWVPAAGDDWKAVEGVAPMNPVFRSCFTMDEEARALAIDAARAKEFLYHDVAAGIAAAACSRLKPQPLEPLEAAKIDGTAETLKKVPRRAIACKFDRVLPASAVEAMAKRVEIPLETIDTGHTPMLSAPKQIADVLLGVK